MSQFEEYTEKKIKEEEEDDYENEDGYSSITTTAKKKNSSLASMPLEGKYHDFKKRIAKGTLYKLNPMSDTLRERVNNYVHGGYMNKDLRYAREIFGLINTSGRKDFTYVWESPWIEEHVRDTAKRKKIETHQKSVAVRNFLKASSNNDSDNVDKFIHNVEKLTRWEDMYDSKEDVKTISRVVQSFERVAVRQIMNFCKSLPGQHYARVSLLMNSFFQESADASIAANSLRRSCICFDLFAALVASELNWADCTNGSRNLSIYANKLLDSKRETALLKLIHALDNPNIGGGSVEVDTIGIPLMDVNFNICISHGVLVVGPNSSKATYVLDIQDDGKGGSRDEIDLAGIQNIHILHTFSEADASRLSSYAAKTRAPTKKNHALFSDF